MDIKERSNYGIIIAILVILVLVAVSYNNTANMVWDEGAEGVGGEDTMLVIEAEECTLYDWYIIQESDFTSGGEFVVVGWRRPENGRPDVLTTEIDDIEAGAYRIYLTVAERPSFPQFVTLEMYYYGGLVEAGPTVRLWCELDLSFTDVFMSGDNYCWMGGTTIEVGVMNLGTHDGTNSGLLCITGCCTDQMQS